MRTQPDNDSLFSTFTRENFRMLRFTTVKTFRSFASAIVSLLVLTLTACSTAFAQPVRIAVGAASVASLPTWVAQDGGYFAREGVPAELIYIRGGPQTTAARSSPQP
jgi:ABC-type nitrate/sulfonate/bicarbonate transport system substrate-binding protein